MTQAQRIRFCDAVIIDGSGATPITGDVLVEGARIIAVGTVPPGDGERVIDARGLVLAPGFIDAHTHDDAALLLTPEMAFKTSQGVTSVVTGNCGVSLAPLVLREGQKPPPPLDAVGPATSFGYARFGDYLAALRASPAAVNVVPLVGHGTLRAATMDDLDRPANADERAEMVALAREAFEAGVVGLSSGLFYPLATAAPAGEVAELVALAGTYGGIYAAHIRDEADDIIPALDEAFGIARAGDVPLVISHLKASGRANFGRSREILAHITRAAADQEIGFDVYPYVASSTMLNKKSWLAAERTTISWCAACPEHAGRDLADVAQEMGIDEEAAIDALSPGGGIYFAMAEDDVSRFLSAGEAMIGSDGVPIDRHPHPRVWGSFSRVLGHYVRERGLIPLAEAVRRMTSLPARRFGLVDRGVIAPGAFADLVLFDADTVADAATFAEPCVPSMGIAGVWVNGELVWDGAAATAARPGRLLARA